MSEILRSTSVRRSPASALRGGEGEHILEVMKFGYRPEAVLLGGIRPGHGGAGR
ncbi:MAG: hypothetical protein LC808_00640 [Actinobacteria bacterium]|nr:hypothetical protein [Actinomycetota bacterium]